MDNPEEKLELFGPFTRQIFEHFVEHGTILPMPTEHGVSVNEVDAFTALLAWFATKQVEVMEKKPNATRLEKVLICYDGLAYAFKTVAGVK